MAAISTLIAAAGLAVAGVGTAVGIKSAQESAKASRQAAAFQNKQANLQNARQKRDAVREARMAYGTAQNTAANQGVSSSSGSQGGLSSIAAQASDNISFLDQYGFFSDQASKAIGRANAASATSETAMSIAGAGMQVTNNAQKIATTFLPRT